MNFTRGNGKLGKRAMVVNRPVGDTCPPSCAFHPRNDTGSPWQNYCYMVRIEGYNPPAREKAMLNLTADCGEIVKALLGAHDRGDIVRMHTGGDFYDERAGLVDWEYVREWELALQRVELLGRAPKIIAYTHVIDSGLVRAFAPFACFKLYASVHDEKDVAAARGAGFAQFALAMPEDVRDWPASERRLERHGVKWLVCPAATGLQPDCSTCRWCWDAKGSVAFLEHTMSFRRKTLPQRPYGWHPSHQKQGGA